MGDSALSVSAAAMAGLGIYHYFMLPTGSTPERAGSASEVVTTFIDQFWDFLKKLQLLGMLVFVFCSVWAKVSCWSKRRCSCRGKIIDGGLGMCATDAVSLACPHMLEDKALIDGFISTVVSLAFGMLGGWYAGKFGLNRKTLVFMALWRETSLTSRS